MKRSSSRSLQFLAAAAEASSDRAAIMSSRPPYRGGRHQWARGFSDRPFGDGGGDERDRGQIFSGDSHLQSVREANRGFRPDERVNFGNLPPQPTPFNPGPHFSPRPYSNPPPPFNPSPSFSPPPPFYRKQPFRPPPETHPRPLKPLDYRDWQFAKPAPPPHSDRFKVLSYNILADYLAINHQKELYFHLPKYMLDWEWRKRSIIFELGLWSADILCFQEVDRFEDLRELLNLQGYSGIWKMRTGDPVDGCAIFWRVSRFKLLHEEFIEFKNLGLRDNVAQICVFESLNQKDKRDMSTPPLSMAGSTKVVICNIHVLYNPKRGEIKLGQIRVLLDRACVVSKLWDDAPVVLCGDFNCTPKSPLYNYISEQKLNISSLPRDKLSGQASAEIRPPRQFGRNFRIQFAGSTGGASAAVDHGSLGKVEHQGVDAGLNILDNHSSVGHFGKKNGASSDKVTKETHQADDCADKTQLTIFVMDGGLKENPSSPQNKAVNVFEQKKDGHESSSTIDSYHEDINFNSVELETHQDTLDGGEDELCSTLCVGDLEERPTSHNEVKVSGALSKDEYEFTLVYSCQKENVPRSAETEHGKDPYTIDAQHNLSSEQSKPSKQAENESMSSDKSKFFFLGANDCTDAINDHVPSGTSNSDISYELFHEAPSPSTPLSVSTTGNVENESSVFVADKKDNSSTMSKVDVACEVSNIDTENLLLKEPVETYQGEKTFGGDSTNFLSELHDENGSLASDFYPAARYNPSSWTPMEIETATGNADCTLVEHHLKLRSTYAEVEDCSGTRDPNGEPLVTSYHRCFLGTVDYIWRSEGLQTVRVLAPIPKDAMTYLTRGFPTKKWGSDHIALVSELAFVKDASIQNTEAS